MPSNIDPETLAAIQNHFHALIRKRAEEMARLSGIEVPDISEAKGTPDRHEYFAVAGMYGGFSYWWEGEGKDTRLITESWSRVIGGSGERHEICASGAVLVEWGFV